MEVAKKAFPTTLLKCLVFIIVFTIFLFDVEYGNLNSKVRHGIKLEESSDIEQSRIIRLGKCLSEYVTH
tara:strand:- start:67 stop:273 length:207 start_codon:yes stop_codon:yes gene_type:complete